MSLKVPASMPIYGGNKSPVLRHKIAIGISSCLLGNAVRYDGGDTENSYISQTLGQFFEFIPFCPEVESGMSIPRPPIQLRTSAQGIRCVAVHDHQIDVTKQIQQCATEQDTWLAQICGYILKKNSPSCGMERVKVFSGDHYRREGVGVFARHLQQRFPLLPLEDEDRLGDPLLRENFLQRVLALHRWRKLNHQPLNSRRLTEFHARHQLIAMSHDPIQAKQLGRIAAQARSDNLAEQADNYILKFMQCLKTPARRDHHVKVLQYIQDYLKTPLDAADQTELIEIIEDYRLGRLPLIVPITLLKHHFRKHPDPFIEHSYYLSTEASDLALLHNI